MTESRRDLALLDTLAVALEPPTVEPTASELFALRVAVASHHAPAPDARTRPGARVPWWRQPWAVASLATGMALAGTSAAMATGAAPVPDPVRAVAHAIGLPVDSPAVVQVQRATDNLQHDLSKPASTPSSQATRDAERLQQKLSNLSPSDRARVGAEPNRTLERWRGPSGSSGSGSGSGGGPGPSSSSEGSRSPTSTGSGSGSGERTTGGTTDRRGSFGGTSGTSGSPQPTPTSTPPSGSGGYQPPSGDRHRSGDGSTSGGTDRSGSGGSYQGGSYPSSSYPSDGFHR